MPTNATRTQAGAKNGAVGAALAQARVTPEETRRKAAGYGLPCSKCRLYYPADLQECPNCHHKERMGAVAPRIPPRTAHAAGGAVGDSASVEKEREEFLRQFKSQSQDAHAKVVGGTESECSVEGHRAGEPGAAEVCKACYERLQERLDVFEAAMHMDLKEAAQIIYDAVWADPSDPNKTYQNAANALLTELRKRAGMNAVMAPFQPLSD